MSLLTLALGNDRARGGVIVRIERSDIRQQTKYKTQLSDIAQRSPYIIRDNISDRESFENKDFPVFRCASYRLRYIISFHLDKACCHNDEKNR